MNDFSVHATFVWATFQWPPGVAGGAENQEKSITTKDTKLTKKTRRKGNAAGSFLASLSVLGALGGSLSNLYRFSSTFSLVYKALEILSDDTHWNV